MQLAGMARYFRAPGFNLSTNGTNDHWYIAVGPYPTSLSMVAFSAAWSAFIRASKAFLPRSGGIIVQKGSGLT